MYRKGRCAALGTASHARNEIPQRKIANMKSTLVARRAACGQISSCRLRRV